MKRQKVAAVFTISILYFYNKYYFLFWIESSCWIYVGYLIWSLDLKTGRFISISQWTNIFLHVWQFQHTECNLSYQLQLQMSNSVEWDSLLALLVFCLLWDPRGKGRLWWREAPGSWFIVLATSCRLLISLVLLEYCGWRQLQSAWVFSSWVFWKLNLLCTFCNPWEKRANSLGQGNTLKKNNRF